MKVGTSSIPLIQGGVGVSGKIARRCNESAINAFSLGGREEMRGRPRLPGRPLIQVIGFTEMVDLLASAQLEGSDARMPVERAAEL